MQRADTLSKRVHQAEQRARQRQLTRTIQAGPAPNQFPTDPVGYCRQILGVTLTPDQEMIARALLEPPYRVMCNSGHSVGKTFIAAALSCWWYDSNDPGVVITTAPTERDIVDLLWTEIRLLRQRAGLPDTFVGTRAPEMRTSDEHYAKGYTARKGESFQGRHRPRMLFIFDEADGVDPQYWTTTKSMFQAQPGHGWLCIGNPVSTVSAAALEEMAVDKDGNPAWRLINLSALDHPNIAAQLAGQLPPYPHAVTTPQVEQWIRDWCEAVPEADALDIEWPPKSGQWFRPGPIAEARMLGRRPSTGTYGVWSVRLFEAACTRKVWPSVASDLAILPQIGCDVARFGDDWTAIHVRSGPVSLVHEAWNGWPVDKVAGRLKYWARWAAQYITEARPPQAEPIKPAQIRVKIDDTGVGGGVVDLADDFAFVGVSSAGKPNDAEGYPNVRSELWFAMAQRARLGMVDLSRLPKAVLVRLRHQACAPEWTMDGMGRRVVEPKELTKEKIGRSPDDMDAVNLAYYEGGGFLAPTVTIDNPAARERLTPDPMRQRRPHLFGR